MKKVFYDSWLAKAILFPSYSTITLFAWELSPEQVKSVKKYTSTCFVAYVQMAVNKILLEACEQKVQ